MARTAQTNAAAGTKTATDKPKRVKGTKVFNVENEKLGKVSLTVKMPEVTDELVESFFSGPNADKNKNTALKKYIAGQQSSKIGAFLRKAEKTSDVSAENALASLNGLKFSERGAAKVVKRSSEDVSKAITALGGVPTDAEGIKALLASLGVQVEDASAAE